MTQPARTSPQGLIPVWLTYVATILIIGFANKLPVQDLMPRFWWEYIYRIVAIALCLWALRNTDFRLSDMWRIIGRRPIACIAAIILIFGLSLLVDYALTLWNLTVMGTDWSDFFYDGMAQQWIDLTLGLFLVALSEELIFRTLPLYLYGHWFRYGIVYCLVSSVLFTSVHIDTGPGTVITSFVFGIMIAIHYRWFRNFFWIFLSHYLLNLLLFSGIVAEEIRNRMGEVLAPV